MKFVEYLKKVNKEEDKVFEAYVGSIPMPVMYASKKGIDLNNPYLQEKYGELLNAEVEIHSVINVLNEPDICIIDGPFVEMATCFFYAAAGNTSKEEYDKLFVTEEDLETQKNPYARKYGGEEFNCIDITEEFVSRYGEFFSDLQKVELSFSGYFGKTLEEAARKIISALVHRKNISFDGEYIFMTFESGKVLVLYASEFGSIYTLK